MELGAHVMRRLVIYFALVTVVAPWQTHAEEVTVKTYRVAYGDEVNSQTWPWRLLTKLRDSDLRNPTAINTAIVFRNSLRTIAIKYSGRESRAKNGAKEFVGTFGWVPPNCNWYHDGFFFLTLNGKKSLNYRFRLLETRAGERGSAKFVGDLPDARATVEFSLLPSDDKLLLHLRLQPRGGRVVKSATVFFGCYPADFAVHRPKTRRRAMLTSTREMRPDRGDGSARSDLTEREPWVLFYDRYYDVAEGRGSGPCALAYDVSRTSVNAACGSYRCTATATLKPGVTETSFVLWDLSGMTNADAVDYLSSLAITPVPYEKSRASGGREVSE